MSLNRTIRRLCRLSAIPTGVGPRDHKAGRRLICGAVLLLLGLVTSPACLAAENEFELYPKWVRPGPDTIVRVKLSDKIDVSRKMFLRLTLPKATITDLPLAGEQVRKRVAGMRMHASRTGSRVRYFIFPLHLVGSQRASAEELR